MASSQVGIHRRCDRYSHVRNALHAVGRHALGREPKIAAKARAAGAADADTLRDAFRIGVPIAMGTDAAVYPHGLNARELGNYVELGMAPAQALMTSSQGSAKLLGVDADTGTLVAGKYADIVVVPGDVLQDIRATERPLLVMKQRVVVKGAVSLSASE